MTAMEASNQFVHKFFIYKNLLNNSCKVRSGSFHN